jgi:hypothetical protein
LLETEILKIDAASVSVGARIDNSKIIDKTL